MMRSIGLFVVLVLVFGLRPAFAAAVDAQLTWTPPTTRADGSELLASEIAGYRIYQAVDAEVAADPEAEHVLVGNGTEQRLRLELMPRHAPYTVRFALRTVDTNGLVSALSETFSLPVVVTSTAAPAAPVGVTLEIHCESGCVITSNPVSQELP